MVKRLLTKTAISLDSDLGMFVGAEAYKAAGGAISTNLFSDDDDGFMDDTALVHRLAIEKLEAKAAELRPHWKWTKAVLDLDYASLHEYTHLRPQKPTEIPAELAEEIERIEHRLRELDDQEIDDWTAALAAEVEQLEERRAEIGEIIDGLAVYSDEVRARAGCIVTVGDNGSFCLHQGLLERCAVNGASDAEDGTTGADPDDVFHGADPNDDQRRRFPVSAEQAIRKECGYSQLLVDDLKVHRHQITRAHLAGNFEVAFDLALYALCVDLLDHFHICRGRSSCA